MPLKIETESWVYKTPFRVSRGAQAALDVVVATLSDADGRVGRGEAAGVDYDGETIELLVAQIEAVRPAIESAIDGAGLEFAGIAGLIEGFNPTTARFRSRELAIRSGGVSNVGCLPLFGAAFAGGAVNGRAGALNE